MSYTVAYFDNAGHSVQGVNTTATAVYVTDGSGVPVYATALPETYGGTGETTYSNGQLLIGDGTGLTKGTLTQPAAGIVITNGAGSITFSLGNDLAALEGMSGTGLVARTASETYAQRTITGTANRITVTNGGGIAGDPTVDIHTSYAGQTSITTLGTVTTGTWNAGPVSSATDGVGEQPSSTTTAGWAITTNYASVNEVDFWSTVNSDLLFGQGFYFYQKISALVDARIAIIVGDDTKSSFNLYGGSTILFTFASNASAAIGTATNIALSLQSNNVERATFPTTGGIGIKGTTSGTLTVKAAAVAGANTITLPAGTTDFSATGGTSQVVKQTSAGGAFTVGQLNTTDLATSVNGVLKGDGSAVVSTTPEIDYGVKRPPLDFDFSTTDYPLTFTRATTAYGVDSGGTWSSFASGVIRRTDLGIFIEEARTNGLRNNSMQGIASGSPGTLPTNWAVSGATGLTRTLGSATTSLGIDCATFRWNGTSGSTSTQLFFDTSTGIAASNGQTWTVSGFFALTAGSITNITNIKIGFITETGAGANITTYLGSDFKSSLTATLQRFEFTATITDATAAFVRPFIFIQYNNGVAIDFTLNIGWPGAEQGSYASTPIRTTSASVTRNADVCKVHLPPTVGTSYSIGVQATPLAPTTYGSDQFLAALSDGTTSNRYALLRLASTGVPQWEINTTKTGIGAIAWAQSASGVLCGSNAASAQRGSFNGAAVTTGSSATSPTGLTTIEIGSDGTGALQLNGIIKKLQIWPTVRLSSQNVVYVATAIPTFDGYITTLDRVKRLTGMTFANLPSYAPAGTLAWVTDSNTATWGATIAGGGANKVLALKNDTVWTVMGV